MYSMCMQLTRTICNSKSARWLSHHLCMAATAAVADTY